MLNGSSASATALRGCAPILDPNTVRMRSVNPFTRSLLEDVASMEGSNDIRHELDLAFDLDGNVERKLSHSHGTSRMRSHRGAEQAHDEISEPIDDCRLTV